MKGKIKEVELYFRDCLVGGHFEVIGRDNFLIKVLVDKEFEFTLWIANGKESVALYNEFGTSSYMYFDLSMEERNLIWKQFFGEGVHKETKTEKRERLLKEKESIEKELLKVS